MDGDGRLYGKRNKGDLETARQIENLAGARYGEKPMPQDIMV